MGMWTSENMAHANDQVLDKIGKSVRVRYVQSTQRENSNTTEQMESIWNIGLDKAKKTLKVTTQQGTRTAAFPSLQASFRTNNRQL